MKQHVTVTSSLFFKTEMHNTKYNEKDHNQIESNSWGPTHYMNKTADKYLPRNNYWLVYTKGSCNIKWSSSHAFDSESIIRLGWWAAAEELPDALLHLVTLRVSHPCTEDRRTTQAEMFQEDVPARKTAWHELCLNGQSSKHSWSATEPAESITEQAGLALLVQACLRLFIVL